MSVTLICLGNSSLFFRAFGTSLALGLLCIAGGMLMSLYCAGDLLLLELLFSETTLLSVETHLNSGVMWTGSWHCALSSSFMQNSAVHLSHSILFEWSLCSRNDKLSTSVSASEF